MDKYTALGVDFSKYTLLIVDDVDVNNVVIERMLAPLKVKTIKATDGQKALDIFLDNDIDMVLTDNLMPGMDGVELATAIRETAKGKDTAIVMISAVTYEEDIKEAKSVGTNEYLAKPVLRDKLLDCVTATLMKIQK